MKQEQASIGNRKMENNKRIAAYDKKTGAYVDSLLTDNQQHIDQFKTVFNRCRLEED